MHGQQISVRDIMDALVGELAKTTAGRSILARCGASTKMC